MTWASHAQLIKPLMSHQLEKAIEQSVSWPNGRIVFVLKPWLDIWWTQRSLLPPWNILWSCSTQSTEKFCQHANPAIWVRLSGGRTRLPCGMDCCPGLWTTTHDWTRSDWKWRSSIIKYWVHDKPESLIFCSFHLRGSESGCPSLLLPRRHWWCFSLTHNSIGRHCTVAQTLWCHLYVSETHNNHNNRGHRRNGGPLGHRNVSERCLACSVHFLFNQDDWHCAQL